MSSPVCSTASREAGGRGGFPCGSLCRRRRVGCVALSDTALRAGPRPVRLGHPGPPPGCDPNVKTQTRVKRVCADLVPALPQAAPEAMSCLSCLDEGDRLRGEAVAAPGEAEAVRRR